MDTAQSEVQPGAGRTKERFTLWLEPGTHAALKELAQRRKRATSTVAEEFIKAGLCVVAEERLTGPAMPAVHRVVEEVTYPQTERLAALVVKGLVEAGIGRRLTYALLDHHAGAETARAIFVAAERATLTALQGHVAEDES